MIILQNIRKFYPTRNGMAEVLKGVDFTLAPGEKVGILGRNGAGKSTMVRIASGVERPSSGHIERSMRVSWPLAFTGAFHGALTGYDNMRFICRIYGVDYHGLTGFIERFTELGAYLREPVRVYSSGMRARLAFAISMMIEFDCYLIDEVAAVGDASFQNKCHEELFINRHDRALIIVSHDANYIRAHCQRACVLVDGLLHKFDDVDEALAYHESIMA